MTPIEQEAEIVRLKTVVAQWERHAETLTRLAEYEESRGVFIEHWRSIVITAAAVIIALSVLWDKLGELIRASSAK